MTFRKTLKPAVKVQGNDSSFWGKSDGEYTISKVEVDVNDRDDYIDHGCLNLYGKNTEWFQYTDEAIEHEVKEKFKSVIEDMTGMKIRTMGWSEQGMQPKYGWNFDLVFYKRKK